MDEISGGARETIVILTGTICVLKIRTHDSILGETSSNYTVSTFDLSCLPKL